MIEYLTLYGLAGKSSFYMTLCYCAHTYFSRIQPWQFGELGLTEDGGNRLIQYTDQIYEGVSLQILSAVIGFQTKVDISTGFSERW